MCGLSVVGRDNYGVFPLKGKPLNVREAHLGKIQTNDEIQNIIKILGLKRGVTYDEETLKSLRYGSIMIMADQDFDGSHIKGLIMNFLHWYNPSLLRLSGFVKMFITPIVKATKGSVVKSFFTVPKFVEWKNAQSSLSGWSFKYVFFFVCVCVCERELLRGKTAHLNNVLTHSYPLQILQRSWYVYIKRSKGVL